MIEHSEKIREAAHDHFERKYGSEVIFPLVVADFAAGARFGVILERDRTRNLYEAAKALAKSQVLTDAPNADRSQAYASFLEALDAYERSE